MKQKLLLLILLCGVSCLQAQGTYKPKTGYVPDQTTAIRIAVAVLEPVYGKKKIDEESPFHADLKADVWHVWSTPPCAKANACKGGGIEVEISRNDSRVLRIIHGR